MDSRRNSLRWELSTVYCISSSDGRGSPVKGPFLPYVSRNDFRLVEVLSGTLFFHDNRKCRRPFSMSENSLPTPC